MSNSQTIINIVGEETIAYIDYKNSEEVTYGGGDYTYSLTLYRDSIDATVNSAGNTYQKYFNLSDPATIEEIRRDVRWFLRNVLSITV